MNGNETGPGRTDRPPQSKGAERKIAGRGWNRAAIESRQPEKTRAQKHVPGSAPEYQDLLQPLKPHKLETKPLGKVEIQKRTPPERALKLRGREAKAPSRAEMPTPKLDQIKREQEAIRSRARKSGGKSAP